MLLFTNLKSRNVNLLAYHYPKVSTIVLGVGWRKDSWHLIEQFCLVMDMLSKDVDATKRLFVVTEGGGDIVKVNKVEVIRILG